MLFSILKDNSEQNTQEKKLYRISDRQTFYKIVNGTPMFMNNICSSIIRFIIINGNRSDIKPANQNCNSWRSSRRQKLCHYHVLLPPNSFVTSQSPVERQSTVFDSSHCEIKVDGCVYNLSIW